MKAIILIIDNVPSQMSMLENMLKQAGREGVLKARTAKEALEIVKTTANLGLIFADWDLPEVSGLDFLLQLKANPDTRAIPVILACKAKSKDEIVKALQSGASSLVIKPYKLEVVKEKLAAIFKNETPVAEGIKRVTNLAELDLREI